MAAIHTDCPYHEYLEKELERLRKKQEDRDCAEHDTDIRNAKKDLRKVEEEQVRMWETIGKLQRLVYMGAGAAGILAFAGSIVGAWLKGVH